MDYYEVPVSAPYQCEVELCEETEGLTERTYIDQEDVAAGEGGVYYSIKCAPHWAAEEALV